MDYQLIVVRNTCDKERSTINPGSNLMNSALDSEEKPSYNLNTRMISHLRSSERPLLESTSSIPDLVIYNRVPKCGSTTMLQVLNHVKDENNFTIFNQIEPDLPVSHISWFETVVACSLKTKKSRLMIRLA